jgi:N-acetylglucosaminyldiphosphoundecaprenol N-acetyl-beta-D-mannosaminyltransferase
MTVPTVEFLGVKLTPAPEPVLQQEISRLAARQEPGIVFLANVHSMNLCWRYPWLRDFYQQADIVYIDGAGVALGAWLLGLGRFHRVTLHDWGWPLSRYLAERGHRLYLLGSREGVAALAARRLQAHAPGLRVVGTHHGYFATRGPENEAVIQAINRQEPDILMVGLGMPLEQRWILENYRQVQAKVFWEVGAAFEFWAGVTPACPVWLGNLGLNWLFRFILEPRRLADRYLRGNTRFLLRVLQAKLDSFRPGADGGDGGGGGQGS